MMENNASCTIDIDLIISQHVKSPTIIIININCLSPYSTTLPPPVHHILQRLQRQFAKVRGTVLLELVIRAVALRWLRTANRPLKDMAITAQIAITICSSYLVFFTASEESWPAVEMVMYRDHI